MVALSTYSVNDHRDPARVKTISWSALVEVHFHLAATCLTRPPPPPHKVLVGHPLDTIKVRIQTMDVIPGQKPQYSVGLCFHDPLLPTLNIKLLQTQTLMSIAPALPAPSVSRAIFRRACCTTDLLRPARDDVLPRCGRA